MPLYAKTDFTAIIGGIEVKGIEGEVVDVNLKPRLIQKMKAQGLITDRRASKKKEKEGEDD